MTWLHEMGHYDAGVTGAEHEAQREKTNHYVTGRGGGRDLDLRAFARDGMRLYGRLADIDAAGRVRFRADLRSNLDHADSVAESIKDLIDAHIERTGLDAPTEPRYTPVWTPGDDVTELDLARAGIGTVIWAIGYRADWRWVKVPAFDGTGYPTHVRGVTSVPGLYVLGLPWLFTWGSGRFLGIGRDSEHLAVQILARRAAGAPVSALAS
jgi:putative flavoprotein involved in K+ transport